MAIELPGFAVLLVATMAGYYGYLRCPRCRGNLGILFMQPEWPALQPRVRFCPYCGSNLDEELPAEAGGDRL
jgi:hypothetical protein